MTKKRKKNYKKKNKTHVKGTSKHRLENNFFKKIPTNYMK